MKTTHATRTQKNSQPVINNIIVRPIRRNTQDIESWRNAMVAAESILPRRVLLYDLYEDLLLDGHLNSIISKRIMAVTNSPLMFVSNKKSIEEVTDLQNKMWFETMLTELMNAKFWGHTLLEFSYDQDANITCELIPRKNVEQRAGLILNDQNSPNGYKYRDDKARIPWLLEFGNPKEHGLLLPAAQYIIYKRGNFGDWAQYAEVFGMPWKVAQYDSWDEQQRQDLEKALGEAGGAASLIIPKGTTVDLKYATSAGDGSLYDKLKNACNEAMSVLILGQTMTTMDTAGSGYAQGKIHANVEQDVHLSDRRYITRILNDKLNPILLVHGFAVGDGKWIYMEEDDVEVKTKKIAIDMQVAQQVPVADDYFYETYGVPKPANYDELKANKETARVAAADSMKQADNNKGAMNHNPGNQSKPEPTPDNSTKKLSDRQSLLERVLSFFS